MGATSTTMRTESLVTLKDLTECNTLSKLLNASKVSSRHQPHRCIHRNVRLRSTKSSNSPHPPFSFFIVSDQIVPSSVSEYKRGTGGQDLGKTNQYESSDTYKLGKVELDIS
jgi:hypothetical protein